MAIQLQPWLRVFFLSFSDGQWGLSGFSTPATQTSIFFKLILSFLQKKKPSLRFLWCAWFCVVPALSRFYHPSDGLARSPSHLRRSPGPYRNALGLVIAFVGAIELYGWLKLPNHTSHWPLNGAQRGAALQTMAAAKFLQWRSTIAPTQAPMYR